MSRSSEKGLWVWLRDGAPRDAVLERIENIVSVGTPDVVGCWRGGSFVCELKSVEVRPTGLVDCELKPEQASFLRRWHAAGGRAFALVKVGDRKYLIRADDCHMIVMPKLIPHAELAAISASKRDHDADWFVSQMAGKVNWE